MQNHVAGALASAGSNVIPVIVPSLSNTVFVEVVAGIQEIAQKTGYQLMLGNTDYDLDQECALVSTFLGWSPPGLIIAGMKHLERTHTLLKRYGKPVVEVMEYGAHPIDMNVGLSHYQAGEAMAKHLIERGYKQIVFVGCQLTADYRAWQRYKGMDRVLAKAGEAEEILMVECDPRTIESVRRNWPFLRDRRIDAYGPIVQRVID